MLLALCSRSLLALTQLKLLLLIQLLLIQLLLIQLLLIQLLLIQLLLIQLLLLLLLLLLRKLITNQLSTRNFKRRLETNAFFFNFVAMKRVLSLLLLIFAMSYGSANLNAHADLPPAGVVDLGPSFSINPNPVSGTFFYVNLNFTEAQYPEAVIVINDILGKVVYSYPIRKSDYATSQIRVDLSDAMLDKGVYFLQIKSGDATKTLKLAIR